MDMGPIRRNEVYLALVLEVLQSMRCWDQSGAEPPIPENCDCRGKVVELFGLQGAAELNEQTGVCRAFDDTSERFNVWMDTGRKVNVRPQNVRPPETARFSVLPPGMA